MFHPPTSPLAIIVHGGAGDIPEKYHQAAQRGCEEAAQIGWKVLRGGGAALDAVEMAVRAMEDNPHFNAGRGSVLNAEGKVEMDAGIMEGADLGIGAVSAIRHYSHPISLARRVMEATSHHFLTAEGAEQFAQAQGFSAIANADLIVPRRREAYEAKLATTTGHDTVGALALDAAGNLAAANSTGGVNFKLAGRVGDSPIPGAGFYADNRFGAVATTGQGEHIMRIGLAWRAMHALEQGATAAQAAQQAIRELLARLPHGRAGLIVLDADGRVGLAHSTAYLSYAYRLSGAQVMSSGLQARRGKV